MSGGRLLSSRERSRGKGFAIDLSPTCRIDHEREHVLFTAVQPGTRSVHCLLWGREFGSELLHDIKQIGVP
jgi:hypothetical protein